MIKPRSRRPPLRWDEGSHIEGLLVGNIPPTFIPPLEPFEDQSGCAEKSLGFGV